MLTTMASSSAACQCAAFVPGRARALAVDNPAAFLQALDFEGQQ
jgi:hypothetical protein